MLLVENQTFDEERALYGASETEVKNVRFEGPADGESALKETRNIRVHDSYFALRYPMWHSSMFTMENCEMTDTCRAALWYDFQGGINNCRLHGIKALRECFSIIISDSDIDSAEFGWQCEKVAIDSSKINSEYAFLHSKKLSLDNVTFSGKYSFQYVEDVIIRDSVLDTKDAFWHSKNVTCENCTIKGEYLGWYSENLILRNCKIIGTQPLCYARELLLDNCTMEGCDLAFEYSDVEAKVNSTIDSVKNPLSGRISADGYGEIITEGSLFKSECEILVNQ